MNIRETPVRFAVLHAAIFVPGPTGVGVNLGPTLNTEDPNGKSKRLSMKLVGSMLILEANGIKAGVPVTNVTHMVFAKEETTDATQNQA